MQRIRAVLLAVALAGGAMTAEAQRGWAYVGSRDVGFDSDTDVVPVSGLARHRQVRLCAFGSPVHMLDVDIRFANGGHQDVPVREVIRPRSCTRHIYLVGDDRNMTEIRLRYERVRGRAQARIRVEAR